MAQAVKAVKPNGNVGANLSNGHVASKVEPPLPNSIGHKETLATFRSNPQSLFNEDRLAHLMHAAKRLPELEGELDLLRQDQVKHEAARDIMLESFKRNHDTDKATITQLEGLVEALRQEAKQKNDQFKAFEQANASEVAKRKTLEDAASKHAQQIESERKKLESLKAIKEKETKRCTALELEVKHQSKDIERLRGTSEKLSKELVDLQKIAKECQKEVDQANKYRIVLQKTPTAISNFEQIWKKVTGLVCATFDRNVQLNAPDDKSSFFHRVRSEEFSWLQILPMPKSNSTAAKHVRCIAIMAVIAHTFTDLLFHPTYAFGEPSVCRASLTRQAKKSSDREAAVRSVLLGMLEEEQNESRDARTQEACQRIMAFVSGLLAENFENEFYEHLVTLTEEAQFAWKQISRQEQSFEPRFDEDSYVDWPWQQFDISQDRLKTIQLGPNEKLGPDPLVVFPRLYITADGEYWPESRGVLLLSEQLRGVQAELEQLKAVNELKRNDSVLTRRARTRRPSQATAATTSPSAFLEPSS